MSNFRLEICAHFVIPILPIIIVSYCTFDTIICARSFIILFGLSSFAFLVPLFKKHQVYLEITEDGFRDKNIGHDVFYSWNEVDNFVVVTGIYLNKYVAFTATNPGKDALYSFQRATVIAGRDSFNSMLGESYSMKPKELAALLQEKRDQFVTTG